MKTIGITGGIGSGKTAVCELLEQLGAEIFYADEEAKRIMVEDPAVRREIMEAFGEDAYREDGSLDRRLLAKRIFGNDEAVATINAIVHPRVAEAFQAARDDAERRHVPVYGREAALLLSAGSTGDLDAIVVVTAPIDQRVRRVTRRDHVDPQAVHDRIRHQMTQEEMVRQATHVIPNDGSLEQLARRVRALWYDLTT